MDSKRPINGCSSCNADRTQQPSKPAMAVQFLRALARIRGGGASLAGRSRRIRRAAYASMARSAGPGRAWSRALLRRLLARPRRRASCATTTTLPNPVARRARPRRARAPATAPPPPGVALRRLVPGGPAMDECELLEEAADYVRWLSTQVAVMKAVMDSVISSTPSSS